MENHTTIGVVNYDNHSEIIVADIPGIIKNASNGIGLGIKFLGHIEKCKILLHFLDCSQKSIIKNYEIIRAELSKYGSELKEKEEILVLTKSDLVTEEKINQYKKKLVFQKPLIFFFQLRDFFFQGLKLQKKLIIFLYQSF